MQYVASNARFSEAPSAFTGKLQGNGHQHNNRHFFQMVYFLSEDPQKDSRTYRKHTDVYLDESTAVPSAVYFPRAIWIIQFLMGIAKMDWHTQIQQEYISQVHFRFLNFELVFSLRRGLSFLQ